MSLEKDIIKEIKKDNIKPKSKWIFIVKNIFIWAIGVLSLIISSLTVSVIIYIIKNNDYLFFRLTHPSPLKLIVASLPYFWILGMVIFVIIFRYTLRQVKDGYKIENYKIIIISIVLSIILGIFFNARGIGFSIDDSFSRKSPLYKKMMEPRHAMWLRENKGMIAGQIISLNNPDNFILKDFNQKTWQVIKIEPSIEDKIANSKFREFIPPPIPIDLKPGLEVRILGEKINENIFHAFIVRPVPNNFNSRNRPHSLK